MIFSGFSDNFSIFVNQHQIEYGLGSRTYYDKFCVYVYIISTYNDLFPHVTKRTKSLDRLKPYINAESNELFKDKHHLEKKSNVITLHTGNNIGT